MEKVIHEVRLIETDDGFRIEVKGDKEQIRQMGFGPGMGFMRHHRHGKGWGFGRGFGRGFGWWRDDDPEGADDRPSE